jgi:hypothetical protein
VIAIEAKLKQRRRHGVETSRIGNLQVEIFTLRNSSLELRRSPFDVIAKEMNRSERVRVPTGPCTSHNAGAASTGRPAHRKSAAVSNTKTLQNFTQRILRGNRCR